MEKKRALVVSLVNTTTLAEFGLFSGEVVECPGGKRKLVNLERLEAPSLTVAGGPMAEFVNPEVKAYEKEWAEKLGIELFFPR